MMPCLTKGGILTQIYSLAWTAKAALFGWIGIVKRDRINLGCYLEQNISAQHKKLPPFGRELSL